MTNELTKTLERVKGIPAPYTFVADTTLRAIDLLVRTFCMPTTDEMVAIEPTRSDYRFAADINHVAYREACVDDDFQITAEGLLKVCTAQTRLIWLSAPNAVTGNYNMVREEFNLLAERFNGLIVVDESLVDFSRQRPLRFELPKYKKLVILSDPGLIFTAPENIARLRRLESLYEFRGTTIDALPDPFDLERTVRLTTQERARLMDAFRLLPQCERVYASDADFFLVRMRNAGDIVAYLAQRGISISHLPQHNVLIIPVGTRSENNELMGLLRQM